MALVRLTIIDDAETVSFVAPAHVMKMTAAACARNPVDVRSLLARLGEFDPAFASRVESAMDGIEDPDLEFVRIRPGADRQQGLQAAEAGVVIFNLPARRIVQLGNRAAAIERSDRGRMRRNGRPVQVFYTYTLPDEWSVVP